MNYLFPPHRRHTCRRGIHSFIRRYTHGVIYTDNTTQSSHLSRIVCRQNTRSLRQPGSHRVRSSSCAQSAMLPANTKISGRGFGNWFSGPRWECDCFVAVYTEAKFTLMYVCREDDSGTAESLCWETGVTYRWVLTNWSQGRGNPLSWDSWPSSVVPLRQWFQNCGMCMTAGQVLILERSGNV